MSTQPKYIAVLNRHRSAKLYQRRGLVSPQRLSDEAIQRLAERRAA